MSWTVKKAAKTLLPTHGYEIKCKKRKSGFEDIKVPDFPQTQAKLQSIIAMNDPELESLSFDWNDGRRLEARRHKDGHWYVYNHIQFVNDEMQWTYQKSRAAIKGETFTKRRPHIDDYLVDSILNIIKM